MKSVRTCGRAGVRAALLLALVHACPPARLHASTPARLPAQDSTSGRLRIPEVVQERARTDSLDNAALVQALEKRLRCTCGCNLDVYTCRTTDFTCATSPAMHRDVLARLAADSSGMTQASVERVIASFVAQYGESILMQPPKQGFNWTAYLMPFVALLVGLAIVGAFARRMIVSRESGVVGRDDAHAPHPTPHVPGVSDADRERLRRELENIEL